MLVGEYFVIVALQNNGYEKVHHNEGHEKLKDRKKDEKRDDKEEKKQADIIKYVWPEDFQPPLAK